MIGAQFMDQVIGYIKIKRCMNGETIENKSLSTLSKILHEFFLHSKQKILRK
jgi:hypothetical protein